VLTKGNCFPGSKFIRRTRNYQTNCTDATH